MSFKQKIVLLLLMLIFLNLPAEMNLAELEKELHNSVGRRQIDLLNQLSEACKREDPEKSLSWAQAALEASEKSNYTKGKAIAYSCLGYYYRNLSDPPKARLFYSKAVKFLEAAKLWKQLANDQMILASFYYDVSDFNEAQRLFQLSLENSFMLKDSLLIALNYNNLGTIKFRQSNYAVALDYFYKSLQLKEALNGIYPTEKNKLNLVNSLNNIGNLHLRMKNYDKALDAYFRTLEISQAKPFSERLAKAYNNIGIVYQQMEDYNQALNYFEKSLEINRHLDNQKQIATLINNIGLVHENLHQLRAALENYQLALKLKEEIGDKYGIANCSRNVGSIYLLFGDYKTAKTYFDQSLRTAAEIQANDLIKGNYKYLAELFAAEQDYENAHRYLLRYITLKDSIFNENIAVEIAELEAKFELETSEKEKRLLERDNLIYRLNIEKANLDNLLLFLLAAFLMVVTAFILYRYWQKKKMNKILQLSKAQLEIKVRERTSELAAINLELKKEIEEREKIEQQITASLSEKEVLLREIHHRVKNNLQLISSILNLQLKEDPDIAFNEMIKHTIDRIFSMSLVHEKLYIQQNLALIDIRNYMTGILDYLIGTYDIDPNKINCRLEIDPVYLNLDNAVACGLIINEIITNSIKHAFPADRKGCIFLKIRTEDNGYISMTVGDDGISFSAEKEEKLESIGLELIKLLARQLRANLEMNTENGVVYQFVFQPAELYDQKDE